MPNQTAPRASGVMIRAGGKILFLKRSAFAGDYPGCWCLPGGGIDRGEGPKQAARREVREETGIEVNRLGNPIDRRDGFFTYLAEFGGPRAVTLNFEHDQFVWAKPSEAPEPLHPGVRATIDRMVRKPTTQVGGVRLTATGRRVIASDAAGSIRPVHPSAATRIAYQRKVDALIDEMAASLQYWLSAAYRAHEPATVELGQDSSPLQAAFDKLSNRWLRKFDTLAEQMADWFGKSVQGRADRSLKEDLRRAGFTVKFKPTRAMTDAFNAVRNENVALIKSIGAQHLEGVQMALSESVMNGRDLHVLADHLEKRVGVTKRRAARIARDQNNRATAVMVRTRAMENGVTQAYWQHSAGGKTPRPEHVKASRERMVFNLADGHDFGNGEGVVWPGTAINCRCVARMKIPGFD